MTIPQTTVPAFEPVWDQTHRQLCHFVCSRLGNEDDAADVLQDVYLRAYRQWDSIRDQEKLRSWLYQIARNRIIDFYRAEKPQGIAVDDIAAPEAGEGHPLPELLPAVSEMIASLPEAYRNALIQADYRGIRQQDLARQNGISVSGMKSRVQRARTMVRDALVNCYEIEWDTSGAIMDLQRRCCCLR